MREPEEFIEAAPPAWYGGDPSCPHPLSFVWAALMNHFDGVQSECRPGRHGHVAAVDEKCCRMYPSEEPPAPLHKANKKRREDGSGRRPKKEISVLVTLEEGGEAW